MSNTEPLQVWVLDGGCLLYLHRRFGELPTEEDQRFCEEQARLARELMPFGKYRGSPLNVVVDDVPYAEWLLEQRWFAEKFPQHEQYLTSALSRTLNDAEGPTAA